MKPTRERTVRVYALTQAETANRQSFADHVRHTAAHLRSEEHALVEDLGIEQEWDKDDYIWVTTVAHRH